MHPFFFIWLLSLCFLPIANSCQINQSKKFGLLSQLALSSQNKFFLKSPPISRKKAAAAQAAESPDADLAAELDSESSEGLSPTGQYENCLSAGLDFAISDLVSLDSQAEVDQGIFLREGTDCMKSTWGYSSSLCTALYCVKIRKHQCCASSFPLFVLKLIPKDSGHFCWWGNVHKSRPCLFFPNP